jgi:glycosyltransferase involved in cell wall biosynthesis
LVSIIIATYNRGEILVDRTLPSIFGQTYPNFEIIVVGDHCIDNTKELLAEISDPRLRFYDLPKRGSYPKDPRTRWFVQGVVPRNRGLELAKGEWLCWISDDDMLLPNHFESLLGFAQKGNYEFVSAVYTYERNGGVFVQDVNNVEPRIGGMQTWMYRSYLRCYKWNLHSWRKEWNRPCDYDLQLRMYRDGVRMGFLEEIVAHVPAVPGTGTVGFEAQKTIG